MTLLRRRAGSAGFTIIELLIAVIIIGILVAIIVPILANRASDARLAAARTDLDALMTAQQHAAIDTGYFYRLYVLDDVRDGDGVSPDVNQDVVDGVDDEQLRTAGNPRSLFILTSTGEMLDATTANQKYQSMIDNETNFNWNGPYVNIAKKSKPTIDQPPAGMPLDPWGQPYMLFTIKGWMHEPDGYIATTWTDGTSALAFDRPTVLSRGPDGSPGDGSRPIGDPERQFGKGDDLFRQF